MNQETAQKIARLNQSLIKASEMGRHDEVLKLLEKLGQGFDPTAVDEYWQTALHHAARYDSPRTAEALLKKGADPRIVTRREEPTPLDLAWGGTKELFRAHDNSSANPPV